MAKRIGDGELLEPKSKAAAKAPAGASAPSTRGGPNSKETPAPAVKETPAPAVSIQAHMPPGVPADALAPALPVLPIGAEATNHSEENTMALVRAIVLRFALRRSAVIGH